MNTSIDVLEVMRKSANVASMNALDHGGNVLMNFADDCEAARVAVAELIDVYEELLNELREISDEAGQEPYNNPRANAALARVRGGQ